MLWLLNADDAAAANLRREADERGVATRAAWYSRRARSVDDHLARHRLADLFLDTLPCNAHTTASDALWAGLPLVTCLGSTFAGRVAASLLNCRRAAAVDRHSLTDYEALALRLARDKDALAAIKEKLAKNRDTFRCSTSRFAGISRRPM